MSESRPAGGATERVAAFAAGLTCDAIPAAVRDRAKRHLLDSVGCAIYGSVQAHCRAVVEVVGSMAGRPEAAVFGTRVRTSAAHAALANGMLISGFEMDDVGVYTHPGACVVAAAFAAAEREGGVDGARLLAAVVAGYEVTIRIAECVGPVSELEIGWHTPPFHGAIGAAACAGRVMALDPPHMREAISIAADMAGGGLMSARYGADVKRLHCGRAAEAGVLAALLARRGFTGTPDVLERDPWGYCSTISYTGAGRRNYDLAKITDDLGSRFVGLERVAIKSYPIGGDQHSVVHNIDTLKRQHGIRSDVVDRVTIGVTRFALDNKLRSPAENATTANFSTRYAAAMALAYDLAPVHQSPRILELWPEAYKDPRIRALQSRVVEVVDDALDRRNPYSVDTTVTIRLTDGREFSSDTGWVKDAPSHGTIWLQPMGDREVEAKVRQLAAGRVPGPQIDVLIVRVRRLEDEQDAGALAGLACPP